MNDKTYLIPVDFWEDFETKEDLQNYIDNKKEELEEAKTKILRLAYITEPKKFIGDNVDILEYIKDELDILFMEIEVNTQQIGNAEALLEQWDSDSQVINESSSITTNNKNTNISEDFQITNNNKNTNISEDFQITNNNKENMKIKKILEDIQNDLKDIKNDLAVIKEEIKTQDLFKPAAPYPFTEPYVYPYRPYYIKTDETYCNNTVSDSTMDVSD